jgi:hypothetical protein
MRVSTSFEGYRIIGKVTRYVAFIAPLVTFATLFGGRGDFVDIFHSIFVKEF